MFSAHAIVLILLQSLLVSSLSINNILERANDLDRPGKIRRESGPARLPPDSDASGFGTEFYDNDGVHLALAPSCSNERAGEVNTGVDWHKIKTVVAFGDSYTQVGNGGDGSPPPPIRFVGKNPSAGGRSTNGETWIEQLLHFDEDSEQPRTLISYAKGGATTDKEIWPSRKWGDDFPSQLSRFYANSTQMQLDPTTTLYVGYFGITDYRSISADGDQMRRAGKRAAQLIQELQRKTKASNILWLGVQFSQANSEEYNEVIWSGLRTLHRESRINFAFVNTGRFFSAIHESFVGFGYVSTKHCLEGQRSSIEDECEEPERTVYYMGADPSRQTHRILAEYAIEVMRKCFVIDKPHGLLSSYHDMISNPLENYITTGHLFFISFLVVVACAYRPVARTARKLAYGMGDIVLTSPRQPHA